MANKDFFTFCTRLRPLELRALGALTCVRHLTEGEVLCRKGDSCEEFYIISRGVVEIVVEAEEREPSLRGAYLSRGDMIGAVRVFTGAPHANTLRVCEPASVQCFKKADLEELGMKIPSFLHYLAEELSWQLIHVNEAAVLRSNCLELSGNLKNFGLVTVFQTILQSGQSGELVISNLGGDVIGSFFFQEGTPVQGRFWHLHGQEAFWQLFLRDIPGTFAFSRQESSTEAIDQLTLGQSTDGLLLNALQRRDEFLGLLDALPELNHHFVRLGDTVVWDGPEALQEVVDAIWNVSASPQAISTLFERLEYSEFTVYGTLFELVKSGQIALCDAADGGPQEPVSRNSKTPHKISSTRRVIRRSPVVV